MYRILDWKWFFFRVLKALPHFLYSLRIHWQQLPMPFSWITHFSLEKKRGLVVSEEMKTKQVWCLFGSWSFVSDFPENVSGASLCPSWYEILQWCALMWACVLSLCWLLGAPYNPEVKVLQFWEIFLKYLIISIFAIVSFRNSLVFLGWFPNFIIFCFLFVFFILFSVFFKLSSKYLSSFYAFLRNC